METQSSTPLQIFGMYLPRFSEAYRKHPYPPCIIEMRSSRIIKSSIRLWVVMGAILLLLSLSSCANDELRTQSTLSEPRENPTSSACLHSPESIRVHIVPTSYHEVHVEIDDALPYEELWFKFVTEQAEAGERELTHVKPFTANEDGHFSQLFTSLSAIEDDLPNRWQMQITHERGIYCESFLLPSE